MDFDPAANGATPFDPAANGAAPFNPADHADEHVPFQTPPGAYRGNVLPFMTDAQGHTSLAVPDLIAPIIRGMVKGGQAALGARNAMSLSGDPDLLAAAGLGTLANRGMITRPAAAPTNAPVTSSDLSPTELAQAQSVERANQHLDRLMGPDSSLVDTSGTGITTQRAAATARSEIASKLNGARQQLNAYGAFDNDPSINNDLASLVQQAKAHTQTLDTDGMLTRLDDLPAAADGFKQPMREMLYDLNNLSDSAIKLNGKGPLQSFLAHVPDTLNVPRAVENVVLGNSRFGKFGSVADTLLGNKIKAPLQLQRAQNLQKLQSAGVDPASLGNPSDDLGMASAALPQPQQTVSPATASQGLGLIRQLQGQAANGASPGAPPPFIRPQVGPAPAQSPPPFIRPQVGPAPAQSPPAAPLPGTVALMRAQQAIAKAKADAEAAPQPGQPDPATGLPNSPIPVNTPIGASVPVPTGGANLPPLRPNTAADVADALRADQGPSPAPAPSQAPPGSPSGGIHPSNLKYIGAPFGKPNETVAGDLQPIVAANPHLDFSIPLDKSVLGPIQDQMYRGGAGPGGVVAPSSIRNPLAYAHRLQQEQQTADTINAIRPDLQQAVSVIRSAPSKSGRQAKLDDLPLSQSDKSILQPLLQFGGEKGN